MPQQVCHGATLMCSFGAAPSNLVVLPQNRMMTNNAPAANIMDNKPMVNILPFGVCMTVTNPQVAAATAAALGVLTPQPCIPVIPAPWVPGQPTILIGNQPAVDNTCKLMCQWAGVISVLMPGQMTHLIDGQAGGGGGGGAGGASSGEVQAINRAFEQATAAGNIAEMERLSSRYQAIKGGEASSAMNVVRMTSAITRAKIDAGRPFDAQSLAPAAAAALGAGMVGGAPNTGAGLPVPKVSDPKLANIVSDLYKGAKTANPIGTGSTADAIRNEAATGLATGGKFHAQKGDEYIRALDKWLTKNPNALQKDRMVAESLKADLRDALGK